MLYDYTIVNSEGETRSGSIEAANADIAINSLQSRGFIITSIKAKKDSGRFFNLGGKISFLGRVRQKDIVVLSRQLATLFEAKISALEALNLIAEQTKNLKLSGALADIAESVKGGLPLSQAMMKYPDIFSDFYTNMVRSGEESGKLEEIFMSVADHLERSYDMTSKARNALIYPAFIITAFSGVMTMMLIYVVPKLTAIIIEMGQKIPFHTKILIAISNFSRSFGIYLLVAIIFGGIMLWRYFKTPKGRAVFSDLQITTPFIGELYKKFYLSRVTDNMSTLLSSGVSVTRSLEITAEVVGNDIYKDILYFSAGNVKGGKSISEAFIRYKEIPSMVTQMIRIGEESGKLNFMLRTLSRFYRREVDNAVDTIIKLIEPALIVFLGISVALLLVSILGPIYNIASSIE